MAPIFYAMMTRAGDIDVHEHIPMFTIVSYAAFLR